MSTGLDVPYGMIFAGEPYLYVNKDGRPVSQLLEHHASVNQGRYDAMTPSSIALAGLSMPIFMAVSPNIGEIARMLEGIAGFISMLAFISAIISFAAPFIIARWFNRTMGKYFRKDPNAVVGKLSLLLSTHWFHCLYCGLVDEYINAVAQISIDSDHYRITHDKIGHANNAIYFSAKAGVRKCFAIVSLIFHLVSLSIFAILVFFPDTDIIELGRWVAIILAYFLLIIFFWRLGKRR